MDAFKSAGLRNIPCTVPRPRLPLLLTPSLYERLVIPSVPALIRRGLVIGFPHRLNYLSLWFPTINDSVAILRYDN